MVDRYSTSLGLGVKARIARVDARVSLLESFEHGDACASLRIPEIQLGSLRAAPATRSCPRGDCLRSSSLTLAQRVVEAETLRDMDLERYLEVCASHSAGAG
jgi:hypothetical protein